MSEFRLRITFCLQGRLVMLSHLELARTVERIVRRADIPYAITNGFSPHMKLSFGAALPVGVGGIHEIFDVWLTDYVKPADVLEKLQAASPHDCLICDATYISAKEVAASDAYLFSKYHIQLSKPFDVVLPTEIVVVRKKKERKLLVSEFVHGVKLDGCLLEIVLEAKKSGSLRIDVLLQAIFEESDVVHTYEQADGVIEDIVYPTSIMRVAQAKSLHELY